MSEQSAHSYLVKVAGPHLSVLLLQHDLPLT